MTPSLRSQAAAVRIAAERALTVAKAHGLRGASVELLRDQLAAAAATLDRLDREERPNGRV